MVLISVPSDEISAQSDPAGRVIARSVVEGHLHKECAWAESGQLRLQRSQGDPLRGNSHWIRRRGPDSGAVSCGRPYIPGKSSIRPLQLNGPVDDQEPAAAEKHAIRALFPG